MNLKIISPQKVVCKLDDVIQITAPTIEGEITVLPEHQNQIGVIEIGEVFVVSASGKTHKYFVDQGVYKIRGNDITVLSDNAESDSKSIADEIKQAISRAESTVSDDMSLSYQTLAKLEKQLRFHRFVIEKIDS